MTDHRNPAHAQARQATIVLKLHDQPYRGMGCAQDIYSRFADLAVLPDLKHLRKAGKSASSRIVALLQSCRCGAPSQEPAIHGLCPVFEGVEMVCLDTLADSERL